MIKKKLKIFSLFLSLVFIIISIFQISQTYSVFYSELKGFSQTQIGRWDILINNTMVTNGYTSNFSMDKLNVSSSPYVLDGKIAPGMYGSGSISIKPQNVDVSFRYDIFIDRDVIENDEIIVADPIVINKTKQLINTAENTYTGLVLLQDINSNYEDIIGLGINWTNNENNNETDTVLGINPITGIPLPISIKFSQYLGESIDAI